MFYSFVFERWIAMFEQWKSMFQRWMGMFDRWTHNFLWQRKIKISIFCFSTTQNPQKCLLITKVPGTKSAFRYRGTTLFPSLSTDVLTAVCTHWSWSVLICNSSSCSLTTCCWELMGCVFSASFSDLNFLSIVFCLLTNDNESHSHVAISSLFGFLHLAGLNWSAEQSRFPKIFSSQLAEPSLKSSTSSIIVL